jgi:hypothetical protein
MQMVLKKAKRIRFLKQKEIIITLHLLIRLKMY